MIYPWISHLGWVQLDGFSGLICINHAYVFSCRIISRANQWVRLRQLQLRCLLVYIVPHLPEGSLKITHRTAGQLPKRASTRIQVLPLCFISEASSKFSADSNSRETDFTSYWEKCKVTGVLIQNRNNCSHVCNQYKTSCPQTIKKQNLNLSVYKTVPGTMIFKKVKIGFYCFLVSACSLCRFFSAYLWRKIVVWDLWKAHMFLWMYSKQLWFWSYSYRMNAQLLPFSGFESLGNPRWKMCLGKRNEIRIHSLSIRWWFD